MKTRIKSKLRSALALLILTSLACRAASAADRNVPAQYPTIQAAVNAAATGDTVHIASGIYQEQIFISKKKLTLAGSPGAVIRATANLERTLSASPLLLGWRPVLGIAFSDVVVRDLTFEGEQLGDIMAGLAGVLFAGSSGRIEHCLVQGFSGPPTAFEGVGDAFVVVNMPNFGTATVNVQVLDNIFAHNCRSIVLYGGLEEAPKAPALRTTFTVNDNIIAGIGLTDIGTQSGIEIGLGARGEVKRNAITGHSANHATLSPASFGILAFDRDAFEKGLPFRPLQPIRYEGNTFRDNQQHLASIQSHGSQFVNNTFEGIGTGTRPFAIGLSGRTNLLSGNHFANMPVGILLFGQDVDFGTDLGITLDPNLVDNHFCAVPTPLITEPLVTGVTEKGTLTCPFPDPTLTIASAVILSWPSETEGWILESSPTSQGRWITESAVPAILDGQNVTSIKIDTTHHFFRLRKP